jgi:hypothetical protein
VNISSDGNTNVDLCVSANQNLKTAANDQILIGNETYTNKTGSTTVSVPPQTPASQAAFSLSSAKSALNVNPGNVTYYRFFLDIVAAQPSGTYNNTITFAGVNAGTACS